MEIIYYKTVNVPMSSAQKDKNTKVAVLYLTFLLLIREYPASEYLPGVQLF
jgi:hypothetical protein